MQLADYLKANKIRRSEFAARIGVSPQMVTGWCNGSFWVSRDTAQKIYDETGGTVTPTDLLLNEAAE
jgi:3,4-dihydroxy 2-butanone 4-phosphate synthase/GTP cyclohydrolase II